jgi:hypothetical protein
VEQSAEPIASVRQLLLATAGALAAAAVILVAVVLPAEYGIDPTGFGARVGLLRPAAGAPSLGLALPTGSKIPITKDPAPYRTDELTLTLDFGEGKEIKASMHTGQRFVYSWTADGGEVDFDMHGEPFNAPKEVFTSYWKDEDKTSANGSFEAPFDGKHGWYWENFNDKKVTIKLKISGYYDSVALQ